MSTGKVVLVALAGIATGALIGILIAPDKGSETRRKIVEKGEDYLDSVKGKFNSLLDSISGKFNGGRAETSDAGSYSRESRREMKTSAS